MPGRILCDIGGALAVFWGVAHLIPTKAVVKGFGNISPDNRRIITMEWIVEGISLIFAGLVVIAVTVIDPSAVSSKAVYCLVTLWLLVMAVVSLFTGFRIAFLPFRLCPFIFTVSAVLVFVGGAL